MNELPKACVMITYSLVMVIYFLIAEINAINNVLFVVSFVVFSYYVLDCYLLITPTRGNKHDI